MDSTRTRRRAVAVLAGAALLSLAACRGSDEAADDYPDHDISLVVPFPAGGPTDTLAHLLAEPMGEELGQDVVVTNVEGTGGTVAAAAVAEDEADGYTVMIHNLGMATAPSLYPDLAYDPVADFDTIGLVADVPMTIVARSDFPAETLDELVAYVTENADTVTIANAGVGGASHLCGLMLEQAIGVQLEEASYDGTGPALTDLVDGKVDFMCDQTTNTADQIRSGEIKAYAVTTPERIDALPDLPTTAEEGLPDVEVTVWHGLWVPAGTPDEIVEELTDALETALQDPEVVDRLADLGTAPVPADQVTPAAQQTKLEDQIDLWGQVIEDAGVTAS
ncbi:tripartite tricarboxylate transporter substrate-binding protein [Nocardioides sp. SR21]|uniref:tripartite tricarboxylate transporter substrate-binding protein n=1 Tax=Nocardioides sp. SR21 TaxID=2919501 RepID=UPI001FA9BC48|nr:tripartite tricarboxylate transporter substrate-binding protein [Nocardioides sp. SR21]